MILAKEISQSIALFHLNKEAAKEKIDIINQLLRNGTLRVDTELTTIGSVLADHLKGFKQAKKQLVNLSDELNKRLVHINLSVEINFQASDDNRFILELTDEGEVLAGHIKSIWVAIFPHFITEITITEWYAGKLEQFPANLIDALLQQLRSQY